MILHLIKQGGFKYIALKIYLIYFELYILNPKRDNLTHKENSIEVNYILLC